MAVEAIGGNIKSEPHNRNYSYLYAQNEHRKQDISDLDQENELRKQDISELEQENQDRKQEISEISQDLSKYKDKFNVVVTPMPPKEGEITNSPKLIRKTSNDQMQVFQRIKGGYLRYLLKKGNGGSGATDTGASWDLLRLQYVDVFVDGYVWFYEEPSEGTLDKAVPAEKDSNNVEEVFLAIPSSANEANNVSSLGGDVGVAANTIPGNATRTWDIQQTSNRKIKVVFYTSSGSSSDVDILVNGVVRDKVNCQQKPSSQSNGLLEVELEIPASHFTSSGIATEIQIRNNTTSNCYIVGFNLSRLKDWKHEHINNYKFIGSNKVFLDAAGASDYAIHDLDTDKWVGSYHGGETSQLCKLKTYFEGQYEPYQGIAREYDFATMANGWAVTTSLKLTQRTILNNKANTVSTFDFDKDGTMEMYFSIFNNTINAYEYFTALTSTHVGFDYLVYPTWEAVSGQTSVPISEGKVKQRNSTEKIELTVRFTRFNDLFNGEGAHVLKNEYYSKFYYGIVQQYDKGINIPSLSFSKGLDFEVNWY